MTDGERDTDEQLQQELRLLLQKVARRIRANRGDEHVTDSQLSALRRLEDEDGRTPGELAILEKVSPPSMNRTLNALESAGYLTRTPDTADARRVLLSLTPRGRELMAETRRLRIEWFGSQLAALEPEERRRLLAVTDILRKLADS